MRARWTWLWLLIPSLASAQAEHPLQALELSSLEVRFTVQTLFEVEGTLGPVTGEVQFTPEGGAMSGELRVPAASADTGYGLRDAVIQEEVLHVERHPVIAFRPTRWRVRGRSESQLSGTVFGVVSMHGTEREVTVDLEARLLPGGEMRIRCGAAVHFEEWGIPNPGNEYLPVGSVVGITVEGMARRRPLGSHEIATAGAGQRGAAVPCHAEEQGNACQDVVGTGAR